MNAVLTKPYLRKDFTLGERQVDIVPVSKTKTKIPA